MVGENNSKGKSRGIARLRTSAIIGLDGAAVDVEVFLKGGQPRFTIIGLGDGAVRESRDRVLSALRHSGFRIDGQILVNLAPAELRKEGSSFDLAIALAILFAAGRIKGKAPKSTFFHGELALDGKLKPVKGAIASSIEALRSGGTEIVVPAPNAREASLISGLRVVPASSLVEVVAYLEGTCPAPRLPETGEEILSSPRPADINEVHGQELAKRAMLIAAAGGHNLLMIGPPGCGKSMLAERFPTLLPPLSREEALEAVRVHSIAGPAVGKLLRGERPFRAPHHVISDAGLVGGGSSPKPGEISLSHHGVLFLDEFPEYRRTAIEALRAPLETGCVMVARAKWSIAFPCRFQLIAAMNPCPCGRLGCEGQECLCSRSAVQAYLRKLSQPILDRIDLQVHLQAVSGRAMLDGIEGGGVSPSSSELRERVIEARDLQLAFGGALSASTPVDELRSSGRVGRGALELLDRMSETGSLSARSYVRLIRVALTIASLDGREAIREEDMAEAFSYRSLDCLARYCAPEWSKQDAASRREWR